MNENSRELATLARYCVTQSPGFAAIALWVPYLASNGDFVAYTDGKQVVVGAQFWEYTPLERAFVLCHEILHVALRHRARGAAARRVSLAHHRVWNIACDAVINHALGKMGWLQAPRDGVAIGAILPAELLENRPAASWSAEAIYAQLLSQIARPETPENLEEQLQDWMDEHGFDDFDLRPRGLSDEGEEDGRSGELASRIWASRLARAQAGDRAGGLLRALSGDFPTSQVPWPQVLRAFLQDAVMPQSRENWNRPSRRFLSGATAVFEPSTQPERGIRRAGVVIDTSGSIDATLLSRFCAEVEAVQARTGCEIVLICADNAVQNEVILHPDGRALLDKVQAGLVEFKGGGGTDFRPAIARLNELKVSVALYFTDLAGVFGDQKPAMPLLWCATGSGQNAPFGRVVSIDYGPLRKVKS